MGGTDGKVQSSLAVNKSQDFRGCTTSRWPLHLRMIIFLIFTLPLQYHKQMHADAYVLEPLSSSTHHPGRFLPLPLSSALPPAIIFCPLPSNLLPCPRCIPLLASSFLCSMNTNSHVIQLLAENQPWDVSYLGSSVHSGVGTRQNFSEKLHLSHHLSVGNLTNLFATL